MSAHAAYKKGAYGSFLYGGERGIRTLDRGLTYTPLAGERLQPLGHLSGAAHCNVKVPVVVDEIWVLSGDFRGKI